MTSDFRNFLEYDVYSTDISQLSDVSGLCRLCLDKCDDNVSIYESINVFEQETTIIFDELQQYSNTELTKDPRYPTCICSNCLNLVKVSLKIRLQMKLTQKELNKFFSRLQENVDAKEEITQIKCEGESDDAVDDIEGNEDEINTDNLNSYDGFLNNLGTVISAKYDDSDSDTQIQIEEPSIEIIKFINNDTSETKSKPLYKSNKNKENPKTIKRNKDKSPQLLCQICGFLATKNQQLRYHIHSKHTINERRHVCNICNKAFVWKHTLEQHKAVHNNERRFLCTVCGNNFNYLSALIYHMRMHTGEKRYRCTYCPKVFSMSWGLTRHLRVHTGAKPYNCEFCNKAFASTTEVKSHERVHTGEKPFECHVCHKKFTKKENMNVHFLTHSGQSKCNICTKGFMNPKILKLHHKFAHNQSVKKVKKANNAKVNENEEIIDKECVGREGEELINVVVYDEGRDEQLDIEGNREDLIDEDLG
nr:zinc finger protein 679-like [Onthophagus taurus]